MITFLVPPNDDLVSRYSKLLIALEKTLADARDDDVFGLTQSEVIQGIRSQSGPAKARLRGSTTPRPV